MNAAFCSTCGASVAADARFCNHCGAALPGLSGTTLAPAISPSLPVAPSSFAMQQPTYVAGLPAAYAGFWIRFVAVLIDGLILAVPTTVLWLIIAALGAGPNFRDGGSPSDARQALFVTAVICTYVLQFLISWLYEALLTSSARMATFGKRAVGIIVTDADGNGLTFGRSTGRYFAKMLSSMTMGIGYIMAAFTERHQALHDIMVSTVVVHDPRRGSV